VRRLRDALVLAALVLYASPVAWQLLTSLTPERDLMAVAARWPSALTLAHYRVVLAESPMPRALANSAGIAARPSTWADMVRPGAILYGYHQFYDPAERESEMKAKLALRPVLSLRARIILLRDVPTGQGVGYNARFVARRDSRIAVIAAGYADGLVRQRSNGDLNAGARSRVIVNGRCAPLVGTISMDLAMVDVTDVPGARVGDVCTIYGKDGCAIYPSDVARDLHTVTSDLLSAIGKRVPRFYVA